MLLNEIKILNEMVEIPSHIVDYLHRNCQPYLNAVGNDLTRLMWRGVSDKLLRSTATIQGLPNCSIIPGKYSNRRPRDSHPDAHDMLNDMFEEYHGEPFRNGIFTTGDYIEADAYGSPVIIFPIGEFKFCWSPVIMDLSDHVPSKAAQIDDYDDLTMKLDKLVRVRYQTTDLSSAILSKKEIMLYCDKCLMFIPGV